MNLVEEEVIICLPRTIFLKFSGRDVVEVDDRHVHLLADSEDSRREIGELTLDALGVILLIVVARREREEDRCSPFGTDVVDESTCVTSKGVNYLLLLGHLIIYIGRIFSNLKFAIRTVTGTGSNRIDGAIVVVTQFEEYVIALLNSFEHRLPKLVVECARRGAAKGMILDGDFVLVVVFMCIKTPAPLTIAAIALGACTHGAVTHQEEHRIVAPATAARHRTCLVGNVDGIGCEVSHAIDVNPDVVLGMKRKD